MGQIFQSFIGGANAGREERTDRNRRNALEEAGHLYGTGDYEGAENALIAAGLPQEAGAYSALGEARRARANRTAASSAVAALGADATPEAQIQAASGAYMNAGDWEQGAELYNMHAQMNAHQREELGQNLQYLGQQAAQLRSVPVEQRAAAARAAVQGTPYDTPEMRARIDQLDGGDGITDADLNGFEQTLLTYQERLGLQREDAAIARQESQFSRSLAAQHAGRNSIGPAQERGFANDYRNEQTALAEALGPQVTNSMSWAMRVSGNGEIPDGTDFQMATIADQGMLRAVARLQTGVGVLTEGEVRDTIGNDLYNRMQAAGADFRLNTRLSTETRRALAQLVQSGVTRAGTLAWQRRDDAMARYEVASGGNAPTGWSLPSLPHPEDFGALNSAERMAGTNGAPPLRPNDIRIAPSGREYTYMGPGNWLPRAEGQQERYQRGRDARIAAGGSPTVSAPAPSRVTNVSAYARALAAFDAGADTPERRAEFERASGGTSIDQARVIVAAANSRR